MQIKNKQRLFLLGKVILFLLTYIVLGFSTGIIAQNIFKGDRFYDQLPFDLLNYAITIFVLLLFVKIIDKENIVSDNKKHLACMRLSFFVELYASTIGI